MKFGALQNVLGEGLPQLFEVAKEIGFDGVELDWNSPAEIESGGVLAPSARAAIIAAAQSADVEIASVCAHFLNGGGIASADEKVRAAGMQAVRDGLQLCVDVGAMALLVPFFGAAEISGESEIAQLTESLKILAPEAQKSGVSIAIEHTLRGDAAFKVLCAVDSRFVGDYWDMANCMSLGYDPLQEIAMLGNRIARVHAKEWSGAKPQQRKAGEYPGLNQVPLGQGQVPLESVLSALQNAGYDGYITIETASFGDRRQSAQAALKVLWDAQKPDS